MTDDEADALPSWPVDLRDPDAAKLCGAWTALTQQLGPSASAPLDELTVARVVRSVQRRAERQRRRRAGLALLAVAAAVLFLVGKPQLPQADGPQIAQQIEPSPIVTSSALAWADPWDQEYAEVQEQVRAVELDWSRTDDQFTSFGERLQALETEWNESPL